MCTLFNLGCKLNQYEGYCLQKVLTNEAPVVIVNTCCVTAQAEQKSRKKFHRVLKHYPDKKVVVTGCACILHPEDYVQAHRIIDPVERTHLIANIFPKPPRSRYFLKIQDGCTEPCTYCIVSIIRNHLFSRPIADIIDEIRWAHKHAYKEVVMVGANIGLYGADTGTSLSQLLSELKTIHDLPRIRLSSIEPRFITRSMIDIMKDLPLCRHFHIPIQSGDDEVLSEMGRAYRNRELRERIHLLANVFPDCAIGCDIIVGFPGEGDDNFQNTGKLIDDLPITHVHVFPYSPRPQTRAFRLGDPISLQMKKARLWDLKRRVVKKNLQFRQRLIGHDLEVIIVQSAPVCIGLSDNYIQLELDRSLDQGKLAKARVVKVESSRTYGTVIRAEHSV